MRDLCVKYNVEEDTKYYVFADYEKEINFIGGLVNFEDLLYRLTFELQDRCIIDDEEEELISLTMITDLL